YAPSFAKKPRGRGLKKTVLLPIAAIVILLAVPAWNYCKTQEEFEIQTQGRVAGRCESELHHMGSLLQNHIYNHGEIRLHPNQLETDAFPEERQRLTFFNVSPGLSYDWLYYYGWKESDPAETIIAAAPVSVLQKDGFFGILRRERAVLCK